jgi:hypothetical protein
MNIPESCKNYKKELFDLLTDILSILPEENSKLKVRIEEILNLCPALKE